MIESKIALVTGAGSGIGRASALALQTAGYTVIAAGRRAEALDATLAQAKPTGGTILAIPTDVANPDSVRALFDQIEARFNRLDVIFNNAGIGAPAIPMDELTLDQWSAVVNTNLTGSFLCAQHAMRLMKKQKPQGGRIINNGSISAYTPRPNSAPYTCTKHAISGLTKCINLDGRPFDICASQIDIGNAVTPLTERMAEGVLQADGSKKPEPRMDVHHAADAVVFMANLPLESNVMFMTVMATKMPFAGRG